MTEIVVISGMSGAGRSAAADVLDDLGFYVIDNLPSSLVPTIVDLASQQGSELERLAIVSGRNHDSVLPQVASLREAGHDVTLVFLDASTPVLVQRYDATRRRHPYADVTEGVLESIEHERRLFDGMKASADLVIDTSELNVHQLKDRLVAAFAVGDPQRMQIAVESFGYKHGLPLDADIVLDVRFLPNPHWIPELRPLTGRDSSVREYVLDQDVTTRFLDDVERLLVGILPSYRGEGRSYLTIAIGCTGGRHRSVAIAEELARRLGVHGVSVRTGHRDVGTAH